MLKKLFLFPSISCHFLVDDITERDWEEKWQSGWYNKKSIPLLDGLINCILTRPAPQCVDSFWMAP